MPSVPDPDHVKPWYLRNITEALALDETTGNVYVRTGFTGNIVIEGNVNIPGTVTVDSSPENPVHVHLDEIGTSGILNVPWMPVSIDGNSNVTVSGNVVVSSGNINANVSGNVNANVTGNVGIVGNVNVTQGTNPWVISRNNSVNSAGNPIYIDGNISGGNVTATNDPTALTAFQEPLAVGITPLLQGSSVYGLDPDFWSTTKLRGGDVTSTTYNLFQVSSGTSPGGYARLATSQYATYQPGQGMMFRWTAAFTNATNEYSGTKNASGITNIVQNTGPIDRESGFSIGYSGQTGTDPVTNADRTKIGILHRRAGFAETRQLTITTYPTGSQTATITLNGTAFTVSLTASTSTTYTAHQIASLLKENATASNLWDIQACDSIVTFVYYSPGAQSGTYSFSSTGTGTLAVGSFSQLQAGATPVDTWTYIDDWNGKVPASFDPAKLNVYGLDFRWLGAGRIRFFMEDPETGELVVIHSIVWTRDQTGLYPHIRNPAMRIVYRSGTTNTAITPSQNVVVSGASIMAGIQGIVNQTGMSQGYYSLNTSGFAKDTINHLISIQNPIIRNGLVNKSSLVIQDMTVSAQGNDPSIIFIVKNPVGTSNLLLFNPLPAADNTHFAQYSTTTVTEDLTQDNPANIQTLGINSSSQFDLRSFNITLAPGDIISVFITSTNALTRTGVAITWRVD